MKTKIKLLITLCLLLLGFVVYTFVSTGFFRTITYNFEGEVLRKVNIQGAEDITIDIKEGYAIISSTQRKVFPNEGQDEGALYYLDLKVDDAVPINLNKDFDMPFAPHGISIYPKDSALIIAAINHTLKGELIEFFEFKNDQLEHKKTLQNPSIKTPNDLVLLNENQFYFTNDHAYKSGFMRVLEDYLGLSLSNVVFYNGQNYKEVASGIAYANGINYDADRNLLFVASPRAFKLKVFEVTTNGALTFIEDLDCNTGIDNIEFDEKGNLWIGSHPNLLHFTAYAKGKKEISPSEIIKINYISKGNYTMEQIYLEDGQTLSASTVAAPFQDKLLVGSVFDNHLLILKNKTP